MSTAILLHGYDIYTINFIADKLSKSNSYKNGEIAKIRHAVSGMHNKFHFLIVGGKTWENI